MLQQLIQEQKFDKLWKILDHNIKTGRYQQRNGSLFDEGNKRCVMGVFLSYNNYERGYVDISLKLMKQYNAEYNGIFSYCGNPEQNLKNIFNETGKISFSHLIYMNDHGYSFEQMRDILKEMDV